MSCGRLLVLLARGGKGWCLGGGWGRMGGGGRGRSRTDYAHFGGAAGGAAAFDEDFAEGSEKFECCFGEIECEYDAGGGCWICAGGWG